MNKVRKQTYFPITVSTSGFLPFTLRVYWMLANQLSDTLPPPSGLGGDLRLFKLAFYKYKYTKISQRSMFFDKIILLFCYLYSYTYV